MKYTLTVCLLIIGLYANAQKIVENLDQQVKLSAIKAHLTFLASDEMRGRDTGSPEIDIAAQYIATQFLSYGLKPVPGNNDSYFQEFDLGKVTPPATATIQIDDQSYNLSEKFVMLDGADVDLSGDIVFLDYGLEDDFKKAKKLEGKIIIVRPGTPEIDNPQGYFKISAEKKKRAQESGAAALIELYKSPQIPWQILVNYLAQPRFAVIDEEKSVFPFAWMADTDGAIEKMMMTKKKKQGAVKITGMTKEMVPSKNVIGYIEGTDPERKGDFLILTAHYDHVGVTYKGPEQDSIFNGARDNAIGTTTLLETAKFLSNNPPAYSVAFLACTAEEKGLLGSEYYSKNPLIPLEQTYFNFNTDGAGNNDTSIVTIIGIDRTGVTENLHKAANAFGLEAKGDPAPEQGLYDRSDNVNFAAKGVPAIAYSPGVSGFDEELMKYYHQPADEVGTLDWEYLHKYAKSFIYAAYLIANMDSKPFWTEGDKYEAAGKALYKMD